PAEKTRWRSDMEPPRLWHVCGGAPPRAPRGGGEVRRHTDIPRRSANARAAAHRAQAKWWTARARRVARARARLLVWPRRRSRAGGLSHGGVSARARSHGGARSDRRAARARLSALCAVDRRAANGPAF